MDRRPRKKKAKPDQLSLLSPDIDRGICKRCRKMLEGKRSDAEYCSPRCRRVARNERIGKPDIGKTSEGRICRIKGCDYRRRFGPFCPSHQSQLVPEGSKACSTCLSVKVITDFSINKATPGGRNYECRSCASIKGKKYRDANADLVRQRNRDYRANNPNYIYTYFKNRRLLRAHGMTLEDFERLLADQDGRCAICGAVPKGKAIHLDHNHLTGKVRGILCTKCNAGLGMFRDNPELLQKAAGYLLDRGDYAARSQKESGITESASESIN